MPVEEGTSTLIPIAGDVKIQIATAARGEDPFGDRAELVGLLRAARTAQGLPVRRR
ncbi:hypothetical protein [Methylobacterium sp. JK268]